MNKLIESIEKFFDRIANLKGTLLHIDNALNNHSANLKKQIENTEKEMPDFALGSRLVISDLTGISDKGWKYYYPTGGKHIVRLSNYDEEIEKIVKREVAYSISQGHEAFSTYLKDILACYFAENISEARRLKVLGNNDDLSSIIWAAKIRNIKPGKNNKNIFNLIRNIRNNFGVSEVTNNENLNFKDWYHVFSIARHKITHTNSKIFKDDKDLKDLTPNQLDYLKRFFPYQETDDYIFLNIPRIAGDTVLNLLSEYAFLIFKELSIKSGYNWKILKNM